MAVSDSLVATGQSNVEVGNRLDISLSGTWTGTAKLQRKMGGTWMDTGDSWTANVETKASSETPVQWRIDWTRTSGTLVCNLVGDVIR